MKAFARVLSCLVAACLLAGCTMLPGSGPSTGEVASEPARQQNGELPRFMLVDLTDDVVRTLAGRADFQSLASFGTTAFSPTPRIGVGDTITVYIWEAAAGGLFSAAPDPLRNQSGSRVAPIPEQIVGRDGLITVPYAGRVRVLGRSTFEVQRSIENALAGKAIQPQVLVSISKPMSNTVTVVGDAAGGVRIPMSPRGDRILDVLASAGVLRTPIIDTMVQVTRGRTTARVPLSRITAEPRENIFLRPDDIVTVLRDPQVVLVYGASGRTTEVPLEAETVSLTQALSRAGGLMDNRADPQGVFIYRLEKASVASRLPGYNLGDVSNGYVKVVYRLNMRDANSIFVANHFRVFHRDTIYVSNSTLAEVAKVLQLFNLVTSPLSTASSVSSIAAR